MGAHERAILAADALERGRMAAEQRKERIAVLKWYDVHFLSLESVLEDHKRQKESQVGTSEGEAPEVAQEQDAPQETKDEDVRETLARATRTRQSLRLGSAQQDVRDQESLPKEPGLQSRSGELHQKGEARA